jgi:hypothetical protein
MLEQELLESLQVVGIDEIDARREQLAPDGLSFR